MGQSIQELSKQNSDMSLCDSSSGNHDSLYETSIFSHVSSSGDNECFY